MHSDIASNYSQRKAAIVRRHAVSSRLIWLLGVILAVILVVVCITLYADTPNDTAQMITIFVVVSAVCIILFVAVSLSCLHSSKKRALTHLASQCQDTADQQPRRRHHRTSGAKSAFESPPPYDSLFDIHGIGISANSSTANFANCAIGQDMGCPASASDNSGGCSNGDSGGGGTTSTD